MSQLRCRSSSSDNSVKRDQRSSSIADEDNPRVKVTTVSRSRSNSPAPSMSKSKSESRSRNRNRSRSKNNSSGREIMLIQKQKSFPKKKWKWWWIPTPCCRLVSEDKGFITLMTFGLDPVNTLALQLKPTNYFFRSHSLAFNPGLPDIYRSYISYFHHTLTRFPFWEMSTTKTKDQRY